jgi:glyoxylase-like metal-dependent hydrolase (beta-lactamase superfamily II)/predicted ester cyclase
MASSAEIAKRYFAALSAHDLDAAVACWAPGSIDRFVGARELVAPDGIRAYFGELFAAFPDFRFEILDVTSSRGRAAVRWRVRATFAGPGRFQDFLPNGARIDIEGCDVVTVEDDLIRHNDAYVDSGDIARQLGFLPPAQSPTEARLTRLANARTRMSDRVHGVEPERIADGVWLLRGGFPARIMNVYFIEDDGGVTMFDAGIAAMSTAVVAAGARFGGIRRVVLGHADCDHRGAAPAVDAPVYCHPADRAAAESDAPMRDYWDLNKLSPHARVAFPRLFSTWDGGAVTVAGTVEEGDDVAGFRVIDLPGHAPGLIGLYRESDRLAIVSDCFYTLDVQTGRKAPARVPHAAFDLDVDSARASIRRLADLEPAVVWAGHTDPVTGPVAATLRRVADAPL